jgi:hypothetical protein
VSVDRAKPSENTLQTITISDFAAALDVTKGHAGTMLAGIPYTIRGDHGERRYSFPAALCRLTRPKYRARVPALLASARDDGEIYVGHDLDLAEALADWINVSPAMKERLARVRATFFSALAGSTQSSAWHSEVERIRSLLCLSAHVLPYVLTGDKSGLPSFPSFSRAFVLVHSSPYQREAA